MNVIKITPRGYCKGVVGAIQQVKKARLAYPDKPIYILGMLVHNHHISKAFEQMNIITIDDKNKTRLELLDKINSGVVVLTAHGSAKAVKQKALDKGLIVVDATCVDVTLTYTIIEEAIAENKHILYIGKKGHPESEGALAIDDHVHLIETKEDIDVFIDSDYDFLITNQTTMSLWDVYAIGEYAKNTLKSATFIEEICNATQVRQEAVANLDEMADIVIVVGDSHSNNSNKLVSVAKEKANVEAYLIEDIGDINLSWLKDKQCVAITSGASTPTHITAQVIAFLEQLDLNDASTWSHYDTLDISKIL